MWDTWTGERVFEWKPAFPAERPTFAPDGRHLLVELYTGTVAVLRLASKERTNSGNPTESE